jgi:hypothetical protein
MVDFEEER